MKSFFILIFVFCFYLTANADITISAEFPGVAIDNSTKLEWQLAPKDTDDTWGNALKYCNQLILAGGDWRLPNINELETLTRYNKSFSAIDDVFQQAMEGLGIKRSFWTSTTLSRDNENIGILIFTGRFGVASFSDKSKLLSIRCVRKG